MNATMATDSQALSVGELIDQRKVLASDIDKAAVALEEAKAAAISTMLQRHNLEYLHEHGILDDGDTGLLRVREEDISALAQATQSKANLLAAERAFADVDAQLRERWAEVQAKAREDWVHQNRPYVVSALQGQKDQYDWAVRNNLPPDRLAYAEQELKVRQAQYDMALAEAPVPPLPESVRDHMKS